MLFAFFIGQILEKGSNKKDLDLLKSQYDQRLGRLDTKIEDELQKEVKAIAEVKSFDGLFRRLGYPPMKLEKLNSILKQAVKNSAAKGYHGRKNEEAKIDLTENLHATLASRGIFNEHPEEEGDSLAQLAEMVPLVKLLFSVKPDLTAP